MDVGDTIFESGLVIDNLKLNDLGAVTNGGFEDLSPFAQWEGVGNFELWNDLPLPTEGLNAALLFSSDGASEVPLPAGVWFLGSAIVAIARSRRRLD